MEFKVGDKVKVVVDAASGNVSLKRGMIGIVCDLKPYSDPSVGVDWGNEIDDGHNCDGHCKRLCGWYVREHEISLIEETRKEESMKNTKTKSEKKSFMEQTVERFEREKKTALNNVKAIKFFEIKEIIHGNDNTTVIKFADGKIYKAKPVGDDVMDLQNAIGVIMAKKALENFGLTYGMVTKYGIHMDKLLKKEAEAVKEVEETQKRQRTKLAAKKKARDDRRREQRIEEQKEAYIRALKEVKR